MANIIQIQDRLKGVRDEDLVKYVKNPTGDVPSYLALGEIKRRKETRDKYTKEKDATTVADDLTTSSMPSGLRSMAQTQPRPPVQPTAGVGAPPPTPQMNPAMLAQSGVGSLNPGSMRKMADGGIIGFKDRGAVLKPSDYDTEYSYMYNEGLLGGPGKEDVQYPIGTFLGDAASYLNPLTYLDSYDPRFDPVSNEVVSGVGDRFADTKKEIEKRKILKRDFLENKKAEQGIIERQNEIVNDVTVGEERNYAGSRQPAENIPSILNNQKDKIVAADKNEEDFIGTGFVLLEDEVDKLDVDDKLSESVYDTITDREQDTAKLKENKRPNYELEMIDKIEVDEIPETSFEKLKEAVNMPDSMEAAVQQVKDRRKAAGLSEDPFSKTKKELTELKEGVKKDKSFTKNMALVSVGVSLMTNGDFRDAPGIINNTVKDINNLSGEDRKLAVMEFQTNNADIALKTGMSNEAGKLIADAGKRLQDIEVAELSDKSRTKLKNADLKYNAVLKTVELNQGIKNMSAQIEGQIEAANIRAESGEKIARIGASKDAPKVALFKQLSKFKDYQKEDGSVDVEKIMTSVTPPSSMYAGKNEADIKIARIEGYQKIIEGIATKESPEAAQAFMKIIPFDVYVAASEEQQQKTADSIIGR
tara:strand:+ start:1082 stop:3016 length:1935 start_codon:yes stop_codon:yes gene_type:complete